MINRAGHNNTDFTEASGTISSVNTLFRLDIWGTGLSLPSRGGASKQRLGTTELNHSVESSLDQTTSPLILYTFTLPDRILISALQLK